MKFWRSMACVVLAVAAFVCRGDDVEMNLQLDLSGRWTLTGEQTLTQGRTLDAYLPGDNYTALLNAGLIPDPFWGKNELLVQEHRKHLWTFSRTFEVSEELLSRKHLFLEAKSVDTFCTISVNGAQVAQCSNQFAFTKKMFHLRAIAGKLI